MKIKLSQSIFYLILLYLLYSCFSLVQHQVLIADDLSTVSDIITKKSDNYPQFLFNFLDSLTMSARPISGIISGSILYLCKYNLDFYFLGLFFFPLSYCILFFILKKNISLILAVLISSTYALLLIGSSVQFSSIMLNSNLALIFFLLSFFFIKNKEQKFKNLLISVFFLAFSTFSYEIFLPCIIINIIFINKNKDKLIYAATVFILIGLYRKGLQPVIFTNSYERESISSVLDIKKDLLTIVLILKMFLWDFFIAVYKAFANSYKINYLELLISILATIQIYLLIINTKITALKNELNLILKISFAGLILSFSIFFLSNYKPTLFGFDNRNLGAIRLFFSILSISFLLVILIRLPKYARAGIVSIFIFTMFITNIAVKNAWIFASDFNNKMFSDLAKDIQGKNYKCISIDYNAYDFLKNNDNLVLREPTYYNTWETPFLSIKNGINHKETKIFNIERKKCDVIYKYPSRELIIK